jgi:hypothetical protein
MSAVSLSCLIGAKITKRRFGAQVKALKYVPEIFIIVVLARKRYMLDQKDELVDRSLGMCVVKQVIQTEHGY